MKKLFLLLCLGILAAPVSAAVVYLKDGSQVRGTIVSATARSVRLHTGNGDLDIQADQIRRVDYAEDEPQVVPTESQAPEPMVVRRRQRPPREEAATQEAGDQLVSLGVGFAIPTTRVSFAAAGGGTDSNGDTGLGLGVQYSYFVTPRLAAGFDLESLNRSPTGSQTLLPNTNTDLYGNTLLMLATARYSLTDHGNVRPYILAGIGPNRTSTIADSTPNLDSGWDDDGDGIADSFETRTLVDESHWGLATTARFGLDFMLPDPALLSLEVGWTGLSNAAYTATPDGKALGLNDVTGKLSFVTIAARWGWRF